MPKLRIMFMVLPALCLAAASPLPAQVNMQYQGQYHGQYRGQFNGQYSGQYYGGGSASTVIPAYGRFRYENPADYPVNTGACGELYFPAPGTDVVAHDSQGRRCF